MSIISLLELSVESIRTYKKLINEHTGNKDYGNDIVATYNILGENIESLNEAVEEVFANENKYEEHFEDDEIQDSISLWLNKVFSEYEELKKQKRCEEKVALAYEYLFEVMLFTSDDEDIKSKITLNSNNIELSKNNNPITSPLTEGMKVLLKIIVDGKTEDMYVIIEEILDDYIYSYIGDKENEEDLIIFPIDCIFVVKEK